MNFNKIFAMQKKLDTAITNNHNVIHEEIIDQRILALIVEVSEFANELASFKYWKKQKNLNRDKIIEEFVDGIHFYVSLSLQLKSSQLINSQIVSQDLNQQFLAVFASITDLKRDFKQKKLKISFGLYLGIARLCDISNQDIENYYIAKNKVNYERIANNY